MFKTVFFFFFFFYSLFKHRYTSVKNNIKINGENKLNADI